MNPNTAYSTSRLPAVIASGGSALLAWFCWPNRLEGFFSLDWHLGHMLMPARASAILLVACAIVFFWQRARLNRLFFRLYPTPRKLCFSFVAFLFSLGLGLAFLEIACRLVDYPFNASWTPSENALGRFDEELGWTYAPNQIRVQEFGSEKHQITMFFDELGIRTASAEHGWAADRPKIALVGGSFTLGHGVAYENSFGGWLEREAGFPYQIVNLGVQAYGTDQALLRLKRHFQRFRPEVVIYTFIDSHVQRNANDDRRLLYPYARFLGTKPKFHLVKGQLKQTHFPARYEDLKEWHLGQSMRLIWSRWGPKPSVTLSAALIQEMKHYVEQQGSTFVLMYWSWTAPERFPEVAEGADSIFTARDAPDHWGRMKIAGDDHPTAEAHARAARLIVGKLTELGLLPEEAH